MNEPLTTWAHITWIDSAGKVGWSDEIPRVDLIESIGIVVDETEESITISASRMTSGEAWYAPLAIPKFAIQKMTQNVVYQNHGQVVVA